MYYTQIINARLKCKTSEAGADPEMFYGFNVISCLNCNIIGT